MVGKNLNRGAVRVRWSAMVPSDDEKEPPPYVKEFEEEEIERALGKEVQKVVKVKVKCASQPAERDGPKATLLSD